jgi:hypothetical protein
VKLSDAPRGVTERLLRLSGTCEQVQAAVNLVQVRYVTIPGAPMVSLRFKPCLLTPAMLRLSTCRTCIYGLNQNSPSPPAIHCLSKITICEGAILLVANVRCLRLP